MIEREFALWADSPACDLERLDNFYELQQLAFLNWLMSGDVIATLPVTTRVNMPYDLRICLIEADRLSNPNGTIDPRIVGGVETNDAGEVVAYHISKHHPLSYDLTEIGWTRVEAWGEKTGRRNVIHIMNRERIGQRRGVPFLAPVIEALKQLGRYTDAELVAAVVSGMFTVFIEKESASADTRLKDNAAKITVKIDGWAASAATIVAMAGDVIEIPGNGVFMVHDPSIGLLGYFNESDLAKVSEELKVIKQSIVNGYALKTGKTAEEIAAIMAAETWYDGKQAVDAGFCDRLMFEEADTTVENAAKVIVNSVSIDLEHFPNMPVSLLTRLAAHTQSGFANKKTSTEPKRSDQNMDGIKDIKTVADLKAAFPDLTKQIEDAATTAATDAERKRIQDIEEVALPGFDKIVNEAKFTKPIAAGDVAKAIIAEQRKQGGKYIQDRADDAQKSGAGDVGAGAGIEGAAGKGDDKEVDAALDKLFPETK